MTNRTLLVRFEHDHSGPQVRNAPGVVSWKLVCLLAICLLSVQDSCAMGKPQWDFELDAYYTALGLNLPFTKDALTEDIEKDEMKTYRDMARQAIVPRFAVIEASVNPFPVAGLLVRKHAEHFYQDTQVSPTLNLIEAGTAGFEEPYALSLFLGKVLDFEPGVKKLVGRSKRGYVGYLASVGNYHIVNNLAIPDNWVEVEWKVKGDLKTASRNLSWSFRGGSKFHSNRDVLDVYYVGLRRSRTDFKKSRYSFLLSSAMEYRVEFDRDGLAPVGHFLLVEKNFPVTRRDWTLSFGVGYLWQSELKYAGPLAERRRSNNSQILIRPNLKF